MQPKLTKWKPPDPRIILLAAMATALVLGWIGGNKTADKVEAIYKYANHGQR